MERMALSTLVKSQGRELIGFFLSEVEIDNDQVTRVVDTFIIDIILLAYLRPADTEVKIQAIQFVSEIASEIAFDQGADTADVEVIDLWPQAATTVVLEPDETIWFKDREDDKDVYWCIHNPDHPLLPGHKAARLA
jgi:hypothetical protein